MLLLFIVKYGWRKRVEKHSINIGFYTFYNYFNSRTLELFYKIRKTFTYTYTCNNITLHYIVNL